MLVEANDGTERGCRSCLLLAAKFAKKHEGNRENRQMPFVLFGVFLAQTKSVSLALSVAHLLTLSALCQNARLEGVQAR